MNISISEAVRYECASDLTGVRSVMRWSPREVANFVRSIPDCEMYADMFEDHDVDGEALLLLTLNDCRYPPLSMQLSSASRLLNRVGLLSRGLHGTTI